MSDNKSRMVSDHHTSDSRFSDSKGVSWSNFDGTKKSHDVNATQLNSKDRDGSHAFYNTKSGVQGVAGPNAERTGQNKGK